MFRTKTTVCSISFSTSTTFLLAHCQGGGGNLGFPSRAAVGAHFPYPSFNCAVHRNAEKSHLKPGSSDTRIKAGEESYFFMAVLVISSVQKKLWSAECLAVVAVLECEFINELVV